MILENICRGVINIARVAGDFAMQEIERVSAEHVKLKGERDLVTYVDQTAERKIVTSLRKVLPEAGFITEEKTVADDRRELTWVIDPLDGTTNFVHRIPMFSVSIALMRQGEVILGVVYNPGLDECFYSWLGGDVFLNNRAVKVSSERSLGEAIIATGFPSNELPDMDRYMELLKVCVTHSHGIRRVGSAALDLAWVACGRYDAYYESGLQAWDVAAGSFLVKQAGGEVSDFSGGRDYLFGSEMIACNKAFYPRFFDLVNTHLISTQH